MGGASSYSTQFLSHSSPRGPPPGMVSSRPGLPPTSTGLYPSHPAQTQKMSQHGGYPGGQQGLKRSFHSEVGGGSCSHITHLSSLHWISKVEQEATSTLQSSLHFPRVFQYSSMAPLACQGIRPSLCSTPLAHNSDVPLHLLTQLVGCLSWASTPLDLTVQYSSPLEPLSPILHSIIRYLIIQWH